MSVLFTVATTPEVPEMPSPNLLSTRVQEHADRLGALARELGQDQLAERLQSEIARWAGADTNVVVAGDIKRGKSSVINALLGQAALLPVDADIATSAHLAVRYGPKTRVLVTRAGQGTTAETFEVAPFQLHDYASMGGDPAKRSGVTSVEVQLDHPLLQRGLAIIDTPGVGGMIGGHGDITLATLNWADALLFTISADAPIARSELDFLARASERIERVAFLLTKIDQYHDWRVILEENRGRLREYARQLSEAADRPGPDNRDLGIARRFEALVHAPFLPISAWLLGKARERAEAGHAEQSARLAERSGFDALERWLDATLGFREYLRLGNILQVSASVTTVMEAEERDRIKGAERDPRLQAELEAEQAAIEGFESKQARWRGRLADDVQELRDESGRLLTRQLAELEARYLGRIHAGQMPRGRDALAADFERSVRALWSDLESFVGIALDRIMAALADEFQIERLTLMFDELALPESVFDTALRQRTAPIRMGSAFVKYGVPLAQETVTYGGALLQVMGPMVPQAWLLGAAFAGVTVLLRKFVGDRAERAQAIGDALSEVRQELIAELGTRLRQRRAQLEHDVEQRLTALRAEYQQRRQDLEQLVRQQAAPRDQAKAAAQQRMHTLEELRKEADELRGQVHRFHESHTYTGA